VLFLVAACGPSQSGDSAASASTDRGQAATDDASSDPLGTSSGSTGHARPSAGGPGADDVATDDGDAATDDADDASGPATGDGGTCPKTITKPSELVFLGDSYLNWGENVGWDTVVPRLETHLQTEGSAAYSATPRRYDVPGANMAQIVNQYAMAHSADSNIDTIVMDGGGNDILLGDRSCLTSPPTTTTTTCAATIDSVLGTAKTLLSQMQSDGVKHILYFFYPHVDTVDANGNGIGVSGKYANDTLDYAAPKVEALCASIPNCVFVDTRPAWGDNYAQYIDPLGFGVHPNDKGSQLLVDNAIWPAMVDHCLAQ
jgi:hypothetical protein